MSTLTARELADEFRRYPGGTYPRATGSRSLAPFGIYKCGDGKYLAIIGIQDHFFRGLCDGIGRPAMATDPRFSSGRRRGRNKVVLREMLEDALSARPMRNWIAHLEGHGVPVAAVNDLKGAVAEPQMAWRNMIVETTTGVQFIGNPVKISGYDDPKVVPGVQEEPGDLRSLLSKL